MPRHGAEQPGLQLVARHTERGGVVGQAGRSGRRGLEVGRHQVEPGLEQPSPQLVPPAEGVLLVLEEPRLVEVARRRVGVARHQPARRQVQEAVGQRFGQPECA